MFLGIVATVAYYPSCGQRNQPADVDLFQFGENQVRKRWETGKVNILERATFDFLPCPRKVACPVFFLPVVREARRTTRNELGGGCSEQNGSGTPSTPHALRKVTIDLTSMTDVLHDDAHRGAVHFVDNSIIPNPQAV